MTSFTDLGLEDNLLHAITDLGFESPTPIQEKAIPVLLTGVKDFVGLAQTGTGKTAAFGLPLLQLIEANHKYPQALIVCPTRELCIQIHNDFKDFKKYKKQIFTEAVYGGTSITAQIRNIKSGVQIVAATPGRLIDLIERKAIDLHKVKYVVLDEADEMLNMGFRDDIDFILENTVNREATWLFSATMPDDVRAISRNYMNKPVEITIGKKNATNANIEHQYYMTSAHLRFDALKRLIDFNPELYGIIFTRTKAGAQEVAE
ncbi:MAG TPA: DEAD/DEAH box helicase, partial [Ginsengibacter sp.]|nr:DEAD/DEAH box helicase [Ginsengibacter sp.]